MPSVQPVWQHETSGTNVYYFLLFIDSFLLGHGGRVFSCTAHGHVGSGFMQAQLLGEDRLRVALLLGANIDVDNSFQTNM